MKFETRIMKNVEDKKIFLNQDLTTRHEEAVAQKCHQMFNELAGGQNELLKRARSDGIASADYQSWCDADQKCTQFIQLRDANSKNVENCKDANLFN